jgi:putative transcriptional regulator
VNFENTKRPIVDERSIDVLLAGYAARTLDLPLLALIAAHLDLTPDNRAYVAALEAAHGVFLDSLDPVPLPGRDRRLVNIFASVTPATDQAVFDVPLVHHADAELLPSPLRRFIGCDLSELPFGEALPGIEQAVIATGAYGEACILRCRPGARFRPHGHRGTEAALVLAGSFADEQGSYGRGDVMIADETCHHQPIVGGDGLLCFMVSQDAVEPQGAIGRLIGRVLGG